jgi:hypothetical protein
VAGQREFLLVAVEEAFLAGEGGPDVKDGEVAALEEGIEGVEEGAFADLLVFEVGREYFSERDDFFDDWVEAALLSPSSSRTEMWLAEMRMLSLTAFSSRERLMYTLAGRPNASSFSRGMQTIRNSSNCNGNVSGRTLAIEDQELRAWKVLRYSSSMPSSPNFMWFQNMASLGMI